MRKPLMTRGEKFDLTEVHKQVEVIVSAFNRYLEHSPYRFGRTKHRVMGPVSKILERAQTGYWSVEDLSGYALRVHEMDRKAKGFVSAEARTALETGIKELMHLIRMLPITALVGVLEKLDYALYYRRRKKASEWMEGIKNEFEKFLRDRYKTVEALREAWKEKNVSFDGFYPSKKNEAYQKSKGKRKEDIDQFWLSHKEEDIEEEEGQ